MVSGEGVCWGGEGGLDTYTRNRAHQGRLQEVKLSSGCTHTIVTVAVAVGVRLRPCRLEMVTSAAREKVGEDAGGRYASEVLTSFPSNSFTRFAL